MRNATPSRFQRFLAHLSTGTALQDAAAAATAYERTLRLRRAQSFAFRDPVATFVCQQHAPRAHTHPAREVNYRDICS